LAPGYFWFRLADEGPVSGAERAAWSLVLSLATAPAIAYNFFLLVPYKVWAVWIFAALGVAVPALALRAAGSRAHSEGLGSFPDGRIYLLHARALGGGWVLPAPWGAWAFICLRDWERGGPLYPGYPAGNYTSTSSSQTRFHAPAFTR